MLSCDSVLEGNQMVKTLVSIRNYQVIRVFKNCHSNWNFISHEIADNNGRLNERKRACTCDVYPFKVNKRAYTYGVLVTKILRK